MRACHWSGTYHIIRLSSDIGKVAAGLAYNGPFMPDSTSIARRPAPVRTVAFVSLGCPKNLVDSEKMLGLLAQGGLVPVADHQDAEQNEEKSWKRHF